MSTQPLTEAAEPAPCGYGSECMSCSGWCADQIPEPEDAPTDSLSRPTSEEQQ